MSGPFEWAWQNKLKEKDAEIERLKSGYQVFKKHYESEIERLKGELVKSFSDVTYQRTLITELCNALEDWCKNLNGVTIAASDIALVQRAREATR